MNHIYSAQKFVKSVVLGKVWTIYLFVAALSLLSFQGWNVFSQETESPLAKVMEVFSAEYRFLRLNAKKPEKRAESLASVDRWTSAIDQAIELIPTRAEGIPEPDKTAFVKAYSEAMTAFKKEVVNLRAFIDVQNIDRVTEQLTLLGQIQKDSHLKFAPQEP